MTTIYCTSGGGKPCPRPERCLTVRGCHFESAMSAPVTPVVQANSDRTDPEPLLFAERMFAWACDLCDMAKRWAVITASAAAITFTVGLLWSVATYLF